MTGFTLCACKSLQQLINAKRLEAILPLSSIFVSSRSLHISCRKNPLNQQLRSFNNYNVLRNNLLNVDHRRNNCIYKSSFHSIVQTYVAYFQALSESTPVITFQNFLINVHDITGLPWWGTIVITAVLFRSTITLPLALYQVGT